MDFKDRLKKEHEDLREKIGKLEQYCSGREIHKLPKIQFSLLLVQLDAMKTYATCLYERLGNL